MTPSLLRRILPCLDVRRGRVVKGVSFVGLRDMGDPVALAQRYQDEGADELVVLDVAATPEGHRTLEAVVRAVSEVLSVPLTAGGGVRTAADAARLFRAGADKVSVNSAAVRRPQLLRELSDRFGRQAVVLSVDVRRTAGDPEVYVAGGRTPTGISLWRWLDEALDLGVGEILLTVIDRDGHQDGYDLELVAETAARAAVPVVASGGAGGPEDVFALFRSTGATGALLASSLHEGRTRIREVKAFLWREGVPTRWPS